MDKGRLSFGQRVALLSQVDEMVRTAVLLPAAMQPEISARLKEEAGELRVYLGLRHAIWQRRERRAGVEELLLPETGELTPELIALARTLSGSKSSSSVGLTGNEATERTAELLNILLAATRACNFFCVRSDR